MKRHCIRLAFFLTLLLLPAAQASAHIDCPPNCDQPSGSTDNANNAIISQIYALLAQQSEITNELSQHPNGTPAALVAQLTTQAQAINVQITALSNKVSSDANTPAMAQLNAMLDKMSAPGTGFSLSDYQKLEDQINTLAASPAFTGSDSPIVTQLNGLLYQLQGVNNQISKSPPNGASPALVAQAAALENQINALTGPVNAITGTESLTSQIAAQQSKLAVVQKAIASLPRSGARQLGDMLTQLQQEEVPITDKITALQNQLNFDLGLSSSNPQVNQLYVLLAQQDAVNQQIAAYVSAPVELGTTAVTAVVRQPPVALTQQSLALQQQIETLSASIQ